MVIAILLLAFLAVFLRSYFLRNQVFTPGGVLFQANDPWYHVRLVHFLAHQFPHFLQIDPYAAFPGEHRPAVAPFLDLVTAGVVRLLTIGTPSDDTIARFCAWVPPLLSAFTVIVVYICGCMLAGRWAGWIAALAIAVTPSLYFVHTTLGAFDHHALEVLLSTLYVCLVLRACHPPPDQSVECIAKPVGRKPAGGAVGWSLLSGVVLACYLLTWIGGFYFVAIVGGWIVVQMVRDGFARVAGPGFVRAVIPGLGIALLIIAPFRGCYPLWEQQATALTCVLAGSATLWMVRRIVWTWSAGRWALPITYALLASVAFLAVNWLAPSVFQPLLGMIDRLRVATDGSAISEVRSILDPPGGWSAGAVWTWFATGLPLGIIGWGSLCKRAWRDGHPAQVLITVWSAAVFASLLVQSRFGYYAGVTVALLTGWLAHELMHPHGGRDRLASGWGRGRWRRVVPTTLAILIAVVPGLTLLPAASSHFAGPTGDWIAALNFLREATPEPYADAEAYYSLDGSGRSSNSTDSRHDPYGVLGWWDYGYWISTIARRIPCANPSQHGAVEVAQFLTAQSEADGLRIAESLGARYVILDWQTVAHPVAGSESTNSKFDAVVKWAGEDLSEYYDRFLSVGDAGQPKLIYLYYPNYYQSMAARLFVLGGRGVEPQWRSLVVRFELAGESGGRPIKKITEARRFETHAEAAGFLRSHPAMNYVLVSDDPFWSCVPLQPLNGYKIVHESRTHFSIGHGVTVPTVRVLEVLAD